MHYYLRSRFAPDAYTCSNLQSSMEFNKCGITLFLQYKYRVMLIAFSREVVYFYIEKIPVLNTKTNNAISTLRGNTCFHNLREVTNALLEHVRYFPIITDSH